MLPPDPLPYPRIQEIALSNKIDSTRIGRLIRTLRPIRSLAALVLATVGIQAAEVAPAWSSTDAAEASRALVLAQANDSDVPGEDASGRRPLEPRYRPSEPEQKSWYNSSYVFGMTRGVAGSTMAPAAKAPLFVLTVPLDIVLLPFAAIGGLFG